MDLQNYMNGAMGPLYGGHPNQEDVDALKQFVFKTI